MKGFREQIKLGAGDTRFYAECAVCKKRVDAGRAAQKEGDENVLEKARDTACDRMTRLFNRCPVCGRWVCDDCFDLSDGYGACRDCAKK